MGSKRSRGHDNGDSASDDESEWEVGELEEEEEEEEDIEQNEGQKDTEMEELEKEYSNLRHQEEDLLRSLKRHKDEDLLKGQAVKNQKALWDRTLELRILLQKSFSNSNKLPQEPLRSSFRNSDNAVEQAYSDLITSSKQTLDSLLELQEALLENNPSIAPVVDGKDSRNGENASNNSDLEKDEEWSQIHRMHSRMAPFRDNSIDKWQRKTQVTTGAAAFKGKLHAFNQNISQQVASYMRDPSRMIKRMQLRRSMVGVFGEVHNEANSNKEEGANVEGDPELLDDSEFYQKLLTEIIDASSETAFYALKKLQTKKRKVVDRKASKSRKIRYHVHEKIVNFMAPEPMVLPPMAPKLFENLFGLQN